MPGRPLPGASGAQGEARWALSDERDEVALSDERGEAACSEDAGEAVFWLAEHVEHLLVSHAVPAARQAGNQLLRGEESGRARWQATHQAAERLAFRDHQAAQQGVRLNAACGGELFIHRRIGPGLTRALSGGV